MLTSFFPAHCSIFDSHIPGLYEFVYPGDVVEKCPEQVLSDVLGLGVSIRRPFLALFALFGTVLGLLGALRLKSILTSIRSKRAHPEAPTLHNPEFYWMLAFLFFGMMNFNGLFLHCLLPFSETTGVSALERPYFWMGDSFTTGAFGNALWAAAMMESLPTLGILPKKQCWDVVPLAWAVGNMVGLGAIAWFFILGYDADSKLPGTLPLEMWYGGPPAVFASSALILLLFRKFNWVLCVAFPLSYITFLAALCLDAFLCRSFENAFLDLLTQPTLMFLATDMVFLGIAVWLEIIHQKQGRKAKLA